MEKLDFDFDSEFNIVEIGDVEFCCWILSMIVVMIVVILEKLEFNFDLEFNIVEFGEVGFFC